MDPDTRKLVEERAKWYGWKSPSMNEADTVSALHTACRDFGIDPKMEDKEVGEVWRTYGCVRAQHDGTHDGEAEADIADLTRKLVAERAQCPCITCLRRALEDFGIEEGEWKV